DYLVKVLHILLWCNKACQRIGRRNLKCFAAREQAIGQDANGALMLAYILQAAELVHFRAKLSTRPNPLGDGLGQQYASTGADTQAAGTIHDGGPGAHKHSVAGLLDTAFNAHANMGAAGDKRRPGPVDRP